MIATLSPAGSNVEESLSTLRYAQQARTIINVAKVNEDTSAKLIRGQTLKIFTFSLNEFELNSALANSRFALTAKRFAILFIYLNLSCC